MRGEVSATTFFLLFGEGEELIRLSGEALFLSPEGLLRLSDGLELRRVLDFFLGVGLLWIRRLSGVGLRLL